MWGKAISMSSGSSEIIARKLGPHIAPTAPVTIDRMHPRSMPWRATRFASAISPPPIALATSAVDPTPSARKTTYASQTSWLLMPTAAIAVEPSPPTMIIATMPTMVGSRLSPDV